MPSVTRPAIAAIAAKEGVKWTAIPTRGGGEMVPFLLGGKIDFAWSGGVHQKYGDKMIVLASMLSHRLAASPDVPSVQELYGISMPGAAVLAVDGHAHAFDTHVAPLRNTPLRFFLPGDRLSRQVPKERGRMGAAAGGARAQGSTCVMR